jgi:hypothetical protein
MWNWDLINKAAAELGVPYNTRKTWRIRRSVPHRWRLHIKELTQGRVRIFEDPTFKLGPRGRPPRQDARQ